MRFYKSAAVVSHLSQKLTKGSKAIASLELHFSNDVVPLDPSWARTLYGSGSNFRLHEQLGNPINKGSKVPMG